MGKKSKGRATRPMLERGQRRNVDQFIHEPESMKTADSASVHEADQAREFRLEAFWRTRDELTKRCLSNTEGLDRSILTLSSATLGVSVTFLNSHSQSNLWLFGLSALPIVVSMVSTLASFHFSQASISQRLDDYQDYYVSEDETALDRRDRAGEINGILSYVSTVAFAVGILGLLLFFTFSLKKDSNVKSTQEGKGRSTATEASSYPKAGINESTRQSTAIESQSAERKEVENAKQTKVADNTPSQSSEGKQGSKAAATSSPTPQP